MTKVALPLAALALLGMTGSAHADQTAPGTGNAAAVQLAKASPLVRSAHDLLLRNARQIDDAELRKQTLDGLDNDRTCVLHRAGLDTAARTALLQKLHDAGLYSDSDAANFPGGALTGVFPPVLDDNGDCPHLPQPYLSSPGSSYGGHHSYPGGLSVHVAFNDTSDIHLAAGYRKIYGHTGGFGLPEVAAGTPSPERADVFIDQDVIVAAPLWHDWAKSIVFQWNADGSEFAEFNFGGNGSTDNLGGAAGDSRTGAHHILGVAETMKRGFSPELVITQASAHSNPTSGNEYKVVNWLRAAAIIAGIDPVAKGYLALDAKGQLRLPALGELADVVNLNDANQTNFLIEFTTHNLSDADFTCTGPAVSVVQLVLAKLAPDYGYDPSDTVRYNTKYRNVALSYLSAERLLMIYSRAGRAGVRAELRKLRVRGLI